MLLGNCRLGESVCGADGTWGACGGVVAPQPKDGCTAGDDANCNGMPNEGCACAEGQQRACGSAVGSCRQGQQSCAGGAWGECVGEVKPLAGDSCVDGNDDNCDGVKNSGCLCLTGDKRACGSSIGNCKQGEQTCTGGVWGTCTGGVTPQPQDACTPGDDADCDGMKNEGCSCTAGKTMTCGNCGSQTCESSGVWGGCTGTGECQAGAVEPAPSIACTTSPCGTQQREQICDATCHWAGTRDKGTCAYADCSSTPGDDRPGWVQCDNFDGMVVPHACGNGQTCCESTTYPNPFSCTTSCSATQASKCDGSEDCGSGQTCCMLYIGGGETPGGICATGSCQNLAPPPNTGISGRRFCHRDSDCPLGDGCAPSGTGVTPGTCEDP